MTTKPMKKSMTRILLVAILTGAAAIGLPAVQARAQDGNAMMHDAALVCRWLDIDSSPASVFAMRDDMLADGVPKQAAIEIVTYALTYMCPEHLAAVEYAVESVDDRRQLA